MRAGADGLRIGIFINSLPSFGGVFQYSATLVDALAGGDWHGGELIVFSGVEAPKLRSLVRRRKTKYVFLGPARLALEALRSPSIADLRGAFEFVVAKLLGRPSSNSLHNTYLRLTSRVVKRHRVDLM